MDATKGERYQSGAAELYYQATHNKIVSFLWGIADDVLRDWADAARPVMSGLLLLFRGRSA